MLLALVPTLRPRCLDRMADFGTSLPFSRCSDFVRNRGVNGHSVEVTARAVRDPSLPFIECPERVRFSPRHETQIAHETGEYGVCPDLFRSWRGASKRQRFTPSID